MPLLGASILIEGIAKAILLILSQKVMQDREVMPSFFTDCSQLFGSKTIGLSGRCEE